MKNYTQGEWDYDINANKGFDIYLKGSLKVIATVLHKDVSYMPSEEEAEANARLISAAPDMYEALKALLAESRKHGESLEDTPIEALAAAALTKAEGKI